VKEIQQLNEQELEAGVSISGSWHNDYNDTAYVFIGGLPFNLTEGDIIAIFSQYGTPVHVKLARDKDTGKSKGFAWLKYEDQRSTVLAVDNFNGVSILGRTVKVDHTYYKPEEGEVVEEIQPDNDKSNLIVKHKHRHHERDDRGRESDHHRRNSYEDPELVDPMRDYFREKKRKRRH
jgi:RNA-binding motif protein, X-linked 2